MTPVEVLAEGDEWVVLHDTITRREAYEEFGDAHAVAMEIADDLGTSVEVVHPRNPNIRRMVA